MGKKLFRKFMCVLLVAVLALNPLDTKAIASDYAPTYTVTTDKCELKRAARATLAHDHRDKYH